jgi:predicted lipoprotein with Yx(FWY)xxD motif
MSTREDNVKRAAALPLTPADISLFEEGGEFVLRTEDGLAIYHYDRDTDGKSHCVAACSKEWPPVLASAGGQVVGDWKTIERSDKTHQWTFHGKPIYTYSGDSPSKVQGDGIGGVWHLVTL